MSRFRVEVQADALEVMLREYLRVRPLALQHVLTEIGYADGLPSQTSGHGDETEVRHAPTFVDDKGRPLRCHEVEGAVVDGEVVQRVCNRPRPCRDHDGAVAMTSVDRAAIDRAELRSTLETMRDDATTLASILHSALEVARRALGQRAPREVVPECSRGHGRPGVIEWGRPWCGNVPDETRDGMCDECWAAEARWREERGLKPHARTVPTPPAVLCVRDGCDRPATPGRSDGLCDADRMADSRARRKAEEARELWAALDDQGPEAWAIMAKRFGKEWRTYVAEEVAS